MDTFYTPQHLMHDTAGVRMEGHPYQTEEVPARAELLLEAVLDLGLGEVLEPPDTGMGPIEAVHDAGFLNFLRTAYEEHADFFEQTSPVFAATFAPRHALRKPESFLGLSGYYSYGVGSPIVEHTWTAAYWSAQCALAAAAQVRAGARAAYALCRPPGHHAAADLFGGFCYLNSAAIAARSLGERTAVLDIDYHHGNGTQMIFYEDPDVLFCSLHAHPDDDYPWYWGAAQERGAGAGLGYNHNFPLLQKTGDDAYLETLDQALAEVAAFAPRYLVVSAGLDIAAGDPVGGFTISRDGLAAIGQRIAALGLPTILVQEGGYLLEALADNARAFLKPFGAIPR